MLRPYNKMATFTDTDKLLYVLNVIKNTEMPQPNYHGVATDMGANNANNAYVQASSIKLASLTFPIRQKKYKAIVEVMGFNLVKGQLIPKGAKPPTDAPSTPSPAKKPATKRQTPAKTPTSSSAMKANRTWTGASASKNRTKKRKTAQMLLSDGDDDDDDDDVTSDMQMKEEIDDDLQLIDSRVVRERSTTVRPEFARAVFEEEEI